MAFDREARPARPARGNKRRKVCQFCAEKCESIDYKDAAKLRRFVSERSKILPRRTTGTCAMHQRQLTVALRHRLRCGKHCSVFKKPEATLPVSFFALGGFLVAGGKAAFSPLCAILRREKLGIRCIS